MTVLFTMKNSIYDKLGCDTWDEKGTQETTKEQM